MKDRSPASSLYTLTDLDGLRQARAKEQQGWESPTLGGQPGETGTSPWAADWDNYIAEAERKGAWYFLVVPYYADYTEDAEPAAKAVDERCVIGNVDGDDIFGFVSEATRSQFAEWSDKHVASD